MALDTYINYADSALSLLPPVLAITLAIVTRKVLLSLGLGILSGILLLSDFSLSATVSDTFSRVTALVWSDGALETWNLYTIGFLLTVGVLMALVSVSGGTRAFGHWARKRIQNGRDAKLVTIMLGAVIFIDDYFNALLVGNVARPVTDQYGVSREKLAYCIDSTSAPVCVVSPISTWGAYIISLLVGIIAIHGLDGSSALSVFVQMIPMNFYAIFALLLLLCVVVFNLDIGPMAAAEQRAAQGQLWNPGKGLPAGEEVGLPELENGRVANLIAPLTMLIALVVGLMLYSGGDALAADGQSFSLIGALENAAGSWSMFAAGLTTAIVSTIWFAAQGVTGSDLLLAIRTGIKSMMPAVYILLMAWTIAGVISDMGTGSYLASLAEGNLPVAVVPALIFVLSAFAALSTGTSYGTFAIMLPIAANLAGALDASLMLPSMAAVLAGGVFGDHCSPISDTTILSSTGSGCHHIDHVATQLPYAVIAAVIAIASYLALGVTGSIIAGLLCGLVLLALTVAVLTRRSTSQQPQSA
ncbi:hypothetical protein GZ77_23085 [Endozoicomonas montiporae]|uniref:Na+/H+ antiporter NhaC-like C-terminal domain-containing protein n=2 Tax=Endozoicomonas montiporae TaxID=1027273 RepID=A0A081N0L1_9GAMM|nr:Na+/H+ antiporter NhaC family protein [Endozoicomonas montiporae]AMO54448.1 Na+/H+ antiporter [Endozoicomonas montiporae CL-33]KEQ11984.1 hypothetical protein GZ77_23085 [Endozoicomonas montiporae]